MENQNQKLFIMPLFIYDWAWTKEEAEKNLQETASERYDFLLKAGVVWDERLPVSEIPNAEEYFQFATLTILDAYSLEELIEMKRERVFNRLTDTDHPFNDPEVVKSIEAFLKQHPKE
jgi:hypothetical protein